MEAAAGPCLAQRVDCWSRRWFGTYFKDSFFIVVVDFIILDRPGSGAMSDPEGGLLVPGGALVVARDVHVLLGGLLFALILVGLWSPVLLGADGLRRAPVPSCVSRARCGLRRAPVPCPLHLVGGALFDLAVKLMRLTSLYGPHGLSS